jgi:hypothetical protein
VTTDPTLTQDNDPAASDAEAPRLRRHYLPFDEVKPGMVLGEPVALRERLVIRFSLPAGHVLTEGNLRNMAAHRAEFLCIAVPDERSAAEVAADAAAAQQRLTRIFEGADLNEPVMARLLDYRSR